MWTSLARFCFCAVVLGVMNALGHTVATILGHTVSTVQFPRPTPGFYSSPLLLIVSIYALQQLGRTRHLSSSGDCMSTPH
jgi:hypothetical protein